jgi:hypothetical protein
MSLGDAPTFTPESANLQSSDLGHQFIAPAYRAIPAQRTSDVVGPTMLLTALEMCLGHRRGAVSLSNERLNIRFICPRPLPVDVSCTCVKQRANRGLPECL